MATTIGECCRVFAGSSAPQDKAVFVSEGIPFVRAGSLEHLCSGGSLDDCEKIHREIGIKLKLRLAPAGTTIFAKSGMSAMKDRVYCLPRDAYIVSHLAGLIPGKNVDSRFLTYWFLSNPPSRLINDPAYPSIRLSDISNIKFNPPELKEQKKIATILDKADEIKQSSLQFKEVKTGLFRSLFVEMFGDPILNPMNWETSPVIDYCTCIVPGRDKPKSFTGTTPWVTTADLNHLGITLHSRDSIGLSDLEIEQVRARLIPESSVILTCVGDLGIVSIAGSDMVVNQQLHTFQCSEKINNIFLMHSIAFQTPYMYKMASTTTVPYMNKTIANNIPTILPPLELQEKFAQYVDILEKIPNSIELATNNSLSITQELLR